MLVVVFCGVNSNNGLGKTWYESFGGLVDDNVTYGTHGTTTHNMYAILFISPTIVRAQLQMGRVSSLQITSQPCRSHEKEERRTQ